MLELQTVCGVTGPVYVVNDQDPDLGTQSSHITCFTSTTVLAAERVWRQGAAYVVDNEDPDVGTHITCFTGTKVRILTLRTPDLEPSIASNLTRRSLAPRILTYPDVG